MILFRRRSFHPSTRVLVNFQTTDNRTYQTNFYEMMQKHPHINLLLQNIR